jgi:hypothetical protein
MAFQAEDGARHLHLAEMAPIPEDKAELLEWIRAIAKGNATRAQARQKTYFDKRRGVRRFEPGAIVKLLKQPGKLKKQKKFAAPFIGPLIIDRCVHDDIYRLRSMDGKKLKGRAVNVERIFPYHTDHEEHVEAPRASRLVADKETPEPVAQLTGHSDCDSESLGGEPEPEPEMGVPSHSGSTLANQTAEEDSMQGLQAAGSPDAATGWADDQAIADEPEQQPEAQEPATESDGDQRATSDQDQPPEAISESEAAPAPDT